MRNPKTDMKLKLSKDCYDENLYALGWAESSDAELSKVYECSMCEKDIFEWETLHCTINMIDMLREVTRLRNNRINMSNATRW